ncbi:hypothetical protein [Wolbachia endosymbiont (group A) of Barypeithes pellucidus]|uniref:hypothetical protein n=1 Tax=Wolbachia endosymbiont (group A) of Barypeithes pellucidus TaxID=3139322 RepID=UPI003CCB4B5B
MKTNIDEPCAGNLQARFFRGSCSNITQTRGVKLQLLPNKNCLNVFSCLINKTVDYIASFIILIFCTLNHISIK